jgi:cyclopropane-fatty-acyl-phospholipid synthase
MLLYTFIPGNAARQSVLSVLQNGISNGHLTITDSDQTFYFGRRTKGCTDVSLNVVNKTFWTRVLMFVQQHSHSSAVS